MYHLEFYTSFLTALSMSVASQLLTFQMLKMFEEVNVVNDGAEQGVKVK
jgi:hypothetical protein